MPITPEELAAEAAEAVAAGAFALHLHPRDEEGGETLDGAHVEAALAAVRAACPGVPGGRGHRPVDRRRRARGGARTWWPAGALRERPDYASVNLSEKGARRLAAALRRAGIGVEAGVWTEDDVATLLRGTLGKPLVRVLVEPQESEPAGGAAHGGRNRQGAGRRGGGGRALPPRLRPATWEVIRVAAARGRERAGGPRGRHDAAGRHPARGNADLVAAAVEMVGA